MKNHDGNESDDVVFRERCAQLQEAFKNNYVSHVTADSKFYTEANSVNWDIVKFTTRVPETIKKAKLLIQTANENGDWLQSSDGKTRFIAYDVVHYNTAQRWLVCQSDESLKRAEKSVEKQCLKERDSIQKEISNFQAKFFDCRSDCEKAANLIGKKWKLHTKLQVVVFEHAKYDSPGRPSNKSPVGYKYQAKIQWQKNPEASQVLLHRKASFVLATNTSVDDIANDDVVSCYKQQQWVERGYRLLKDPLFFANGFYLKKPSRISALIMIVTLSLMVYTIAQKRLREAMKKKNVKLPNQIGKLVDSLTIRRAFQVLQGINFVKTDDYKSGFVQGLTDRQRDIIQLIDGAGFHLYRLQEYEESDHILSGIAKESMA